MSKTAYKPGFIFPILLASTFHFHSLRDSPRSFLITILPHPVAHSNQILPTRSLPCTEQPYGPRRGSYPPFASPALRHPAVDSPRPPRQTRSGAGRARPRGGGWPSALSTGIAQAQPLPRSPSVCDTRQPSPATRHPSAVIIQCALMVLDNSQHDTAPSRLLRRRSPHRRGSCSAQTSRS